MRWRVYGPPTGAVRPNWASGQAAALRWWWPVADYLGGTFVREGGPSAVNATATATVAAGWNAVVGRTLSLNGSDARAQGDGTPNVASRFTVSVWIVPAVLPTSGNLQSFLSKYDYRTNLAAENGGFDFRLYNNSGTQTVQFTAVVATNGAAVTASVNRTLTVGQAYLVTATFDGASYRLYIDGVQAALTNDARTVLSNAKLLNIGAFGYYTALSTDLGRYFNGQIGDVRIYDRCLSAAEVWRLWDPATRWEMWRPVARQWTVYDPTAPAVTRARMIGGGGTRLWRAGAG